MLPSVITGPVDLDVAPGDLGAAVARRVAAALCAQAGLGLDRLSDAAILAESLVASAAPGGERLRMELVAGEGVVTISVGPLPAGGAPRLRESAAIPGVGSVVDRLPDSVSVRNDDDGEFFVMSFGADGLATGGAGI